LKAVKVKDGKALDQVSVVEKIILTMNKWEESLPSPFGYYHNNVVMYSLSASLLRNVFVLLACSIILSSCKETEEENACSFTQAEFTYGSPVAGKTASCSWNSSNDPELAIPNPVPTFTSSSRAGVFTASPAGLTFVDDKTGEIDLQATQPGTYTITNTLIECGVAATTQLEVIAPETLTIEEVVFNTIVYMAYYRIKEAADNPELTDETKYQIAWYLVRSTGEIVDIKDVSLPAESYGSTELPYFITPNPETGLTRTDAALVVDVTNLQTGCMSRFTFGKPLSELPAPGKDL
jgi:hypothetical protein